jgi:alanine or glycine:cation symporter, AGCS family
MLDLALHYLDIIDDLFWGYLGVPALILMGIYLSIKSKFFQIRAFPKISKLFFKFITCCNLDDPECIKPRGIPPIQAFFASIGGSIGIGNIVSVCTAVQIGGPGAVLWMWIAAALGMLVKYGEIFLGVKYRIKNDHNSYDGGPMIYLQRVFKGKFIPNLLAVLLCIYGVEVYMFKIIGHSISTTWGLDYNAVILGLLAIILFAGKGGVRLVGKISSALIPIFLLLFFGLSSWVFILNFSKIPAVFAAIFKGAFSGHAALGGFAGSTLMMTVSQGVKRACYTGDIGIGYASVIHSETEEANPGKQAALGIFGIFLDTFVICTLSVLLIMITGVWSQGIHEDTVVAAALAKYFPHVEYIWPIFIFLLGYSSLIAFFAVGRKAANFLSPKYGKVVFFVYSVFAFLFFAFIGNEGQALALMSVIGMMLLAINLYGMFLMRNDIKFSLDEK